LRPEDRGCLARRCAFRRRVQRSARIVLAFLRRLSNRRKWAFRGAPTGPTRGGQVCIRRRQERRNTSLRPRPPSRLTRPAWTGASDFDGATPLDRTPPRQALLQENRGWLAPPPGPDPWPSPCGGVRKEYGGVLEEGDRFRVIPLSILPPPRWGRDRGWGAAPPAGFKTRAPNPEPVSPPSPTLPPSRGEGRCANRPRKPPTGTALKSMAASPDVFRGSASGRGCHPQGGAKHQHTLCAPRSGGSSAAILDSPGLASPYRSTMGFKV
jgi:hypothetical protein